MEIISHSCGTAISVSQVKHQICVKMVARDQRILDGQNNENKNQYKNNDLRDRSTLELSKTHIHPLLDHTLKNY
jgi:hypothetical protein